MQPNDSVEGRSAVVAPLGASRPEARVSEELEAVEWLLGQVRNGNPLPVVDAEAVVHALYLDMRTEGRTLVRLRPLHEMSHYGAVHALNVAQLAMALAEQIDFEREAVLSVGLAGLLHDIGMVFVPVELIAKAEQLDTRERELIRKHPIEGARIIVKADASLALPAVVAYEHHLRPDGSGYPALSYPRTPHRISRLVQVCDTYHAVRTPRPFREAWPSDVIFSFLQQRAGSDFDPEMATRLIALIAMNER